MPDIADPQVVTFSNQRVRVIADKVVALQYALLAYQADYAAQGIANKVVAAGTTGTIADGAATDGRPIITGTSILNQKAAVDALVTAIGTTLVAGVGSTALTINNGIQVNGSPR
jgi:hypothetical protein